MSPSSQDLQNAKIIVSHYESLLFNHPKLRRKWGKRGKSGVSIREGDDEDVVLGKGLYQEVGIGKKRKREGRLEGVDQFQLLGMLSTIQYARSIFEANEIETRRFDGSTSSLLSPPIFSRLTAVETRVSSALGFDNPPTTSSTSTSTPPSPPIALPPSLLNSDFDFDNDPYLESLQDFLSPGPMPIPAPPSSLPQTNGVISTGIGVERKTSRRPRLGTTTNVVVEDGGNEVEGSFEGENEQGAMADGGNMAEEGTAFADRPLPYYPSDETTKIGPRSLSPLSKEDPKSSRTNWKPTVGTAGPNPSSDTYLKRRRRLGLDQDQLSEASGPKRLTEEDFAPSSSKDSHLLDHHSSLHSTLSSHLLSQSHQLKLNSLHFSNLLVKDKEVLEETMDKMSVGEIGMKRERGRLGVLEGKGWKTGCGMVGMWLVIAIIWTMMVVLIRIT